MIAFEVFAIAVVVAIALAVMGRASLRAALAFAGLGLVVGALAAFARPAPPGPPPPGTPARTSEDGYASSDACRSCHPSEHASWFLSFHKTMTQRATPSAIRASLPQTVELEGSRWNLRADGEEVTVEHDSETTPLVLATGSHHYQAYWTLGARPGELRLVPFVWMIAERRWVARRDVFLQPPGSPLAVTSPGARWNSNCAMCHAVAGRPGHEEESNSFKTRAAELGIACEACHGPGAAHVEARKNPLARLSQTGTKDPTIVNPARLDAARGSAVCGQCHSFAYPKDEDAYWARGYAGRFFPGDALEPTRFVLFPDTLREKGAPRIEADEDGIYWSDGTIRVGGREYNGLVKSPCFERGEGERKLSCLSCHSMHESEPDDQLRRDRSTSATCLGCHAGRDASTHVRHAPGSAATECVACHMPKTTYALLKGIRSHRIESPNITTTLATGRPPACNLCHLDRSLGWTEERLRVWYGAKPVAIPDAERNLPVAAALALRGDAAMRALAADALGSDDALAASGRDWQASILDELTRDDYAAVRWIAVRSRARFGAATRSIVDDRAVTALLAQKDRRRITISE